MFVLTATWLQISPFNLKIVGPSFPPQHAILPLNEVRFVSPSAISFACYRRLWFEYTPSSDNQSSKHTGNQLGRTAIDTQLDLDSVVNQSSPPEPAYVTAVDTIKQQRLARGGILHHESVIKFRDSRMACGNGWSHRVFAIQGLRGLCVSTVETCALFHCMISLLEWWWWWWWCMCVCAPACYLDEWGHTANYSLCEYTECMTLALMCEAEFCNRSDESVWIMFMVRQRDVKPILDL